MNNCDTIQELTVRLRSLPTDLFEHFKMMLGSVEKVYQAQSARILLLRLVPSEIHSVMTYSFVDEDGPDFALDMPIKAWKNERRLQWQARAATRIRARPPDLIHINLEEGVHPTANVEFLHRTVQDFLVVPEVQSLLRHRSTLSSTYEYFISSYLAQLKISRKSEYLSEMMRVGIMRTMRRLDRTRVPFCILMLDELDTCLLQKLNALRIKALMCSHLGFSHRELTDNIRSILPLAMSAYLDGYIKKKSQSNSTTAQSVRAQVTTMFLGSHGRAWQGAVNKERATQVANCELLQHLLTHGMSPHSNFRGYSDAGCLPETIWSWCLRCLFTDDHNLPALYAVNMILIFLQHGADPHARVSVPTYQQINVRLGLLDAVEQFYGQWATVELESYFRRVAHQEQEMRQVSEITLPLHNARSIHEV